MKINSLVAGFALVALLGGCSPQTQQQVEDTSKAVAADVKQGAADAVDATKDAAAAAETTTKVKAALVASSNIDSTGINVDTVGTTVALKGTVPTEEQKTTAEEVAKNTAPAGSTIQNELTVGPIPTGTPAASADGSATPTSALTPTATGTVEPGHEGHNHAPGEGHDHEHAPGDGHNH